MLKETRDAMLAIARFTANRADITRKELLKNAENSEKFKEAYYLFTVAEQARKHEEELLKEDKKDNEDDTKI